MAAGRFFWIDAFSAEPFAGNPAAVCLLQKSVPAAAMQSLAAEFNVSETVFLEGGDGSYRIRWFTPTRELPLVGHATLAAACAIMTSIEPGRDQLSFHSHLSGILPAKRHPAGFAITLPTDKTEPCATPDDLARGLGQQPAETRIGRHYIAVFSSVREISAISPDFQALARLDRPTIAATAPGEEEDYVLRFFAPANGVPEDPVSGVAQCSLAPYWAQRLARSMVRSRQLSIRGGTMVCELTDGGVLISGPCRMLAEGVLNDLGAADGTETSN